MASYQKAYIYPCKGDSPSFSNGMAVQFNPSEITIEEAIGSNSVENNGETGSILKRTKGREIGRQWPDASSKKGERNELTLSVTLFFNTLESINRESYQDVRDYIRPLYPYSNRITSENKGKNRKIEKICFQWGSIVIVGILTQLSVHYTMFAPDGKPVRAEVAISVKGDYHGEQDVKIKKTSGTGEWTSFGNIEMSMALYTDPSAWRNLVGAITNPRNLLG